MLRTHALLDAASQAGARQVHTPRTGTAAEVLAWTSEVCIASMQYKGAILLAHAKEVRDDGSIVEIVIWELPEPLLPCLHRYKYRLYYGLPGECRVRYDNERGKGDHRHFGDREGQYVFASIDRLLDDFRSDVERWE